MRLKNWKKKLSNLDKERTKEQEQEFEANVFAACLLMPKEIFIEKYAELRFDADLIPKLANIFQVSGQFIAFRLELLGLIDQHPF